MTDRRAEAYNEIFGGRTQAPPHHGFPPSNAYYGGPGSYAHQQVTAPPFHPQQYYQPPLHNSDLYAPYEANPSPVSVSSFRDITPSGLQDDVSSMSSTMGGIPSSNTLASNSFSIGGAGVRRSGTPPLLTMKTSMQRSATYAGQYSRRLKLDSNVYAESEIDSAISPTSTVGGGGVFFPDAGSDEGANSPSQLPYRRPNSTSRDSFESDSNSLYSSPTTAHAHSVNPPSDPSSSSSIIPLPNPYSPIPNNSPLMQQQLDKFSQRHSSFGSQTYAPTPPPQNHHLAGFYNPHAPVQASYAFPHLQPLRSASPTSISNSLGVRKSSESVIGHRVSGNGENYENSSRSMSFSSDVQGRINSDVALAQLVGRHSGSSSRRSTGTPQLPMSASLSKKTPIVYPALLSRVAEAFRNRITLTDRTKDTLTYKDAFDGREAVDRICHIIKTTDRNLALLLGRALDAQKFFHDVTYEHRLRDSKHEIYQFQSRERFSEDDLLNGEDAHTIASATTTNSIATGGPSGVFTLLTDCYSSTCARDKLCYSISCPRRLEQQARLNLKPKPVLEPPKPPVENEWGDLRVGSEPGTLWVHSVPQEIVDGVSETEKKRQEAINELIYTERDFVRDMLYLQERWVNPLRSSNVVPEADREDFVTQVFWNINEILAVNLRFSESLNARQKLAPIVESVADIVLEFTPRFGPFVNYGSHQIYGKYEFEKMKSLNLAFSKFVDEVERLPESRKLELNGYLTKPTTRLARYPLLLEAILKHTSPDNPDKHNIPKAVKQIREILTRLNAESGKAENRFNLQQLDSQMVFKNGEAVDLKLNDETRELVFKGPLKKKGGQGEAAELQVFLFDHALLMVKQKTSSKMEQYKVYRKPIPIELLVVRVIDEVQPNPTGRERPKSLMTRTNQGRLQNPSPAINKQGYAIKFIHLGKRGYEITLWATTHSARKKWVDKIEEQQNELRERSMVFETVTLSEGYFVGSNRITAATPFDFGRRIVYGTDNGVYLATLGEKERVPVKVISVPMVTQLDVLEEHGVLVVLADRAVQTFFIDTLDPADATGAGKRAKKIMPNATFFKTGICIDRTLVCMCRSTPSKTVVKVWEPIDQGSAHRGRRQPAIRKFLPSPTEALKLFKEFVVEQRDASSIHFLKAKICMGCSKGFEIVDPLSLDTQGLLDPADSSLDFCQKRDNVRPMAIYRVDGNFLLCYDEFAFYVNKNGWRARSNWLIHWEGNPTAFALHYPYVIAFEPTFIEVRHVDSGNLMQIIPGNHIRCLFADSPPSSSSSSTSINYYSPNRGYSTLYNPMPGHPMMPQMAPLTVAQYRRGEILFACDNDRVLRLQLALPS